MYERNQEGYHDPTACRAVDHVMRLQETSRLTYRIRETCPAGASCRTEGGGSRDQRRTGYQDKSRN